MFHQGDIGTHWYAVISGTLDVCLKNPDSPDEVRMIINTIIVIIVHGSYFIIISSYAYLILFCRTQVFVQLVKGIHLEKALSLEGRGMYCNILYTCTCHKSYTNIHTILNF